MSKKLILLRHGESIWNLENRFTGWTDVDLTKNGMNEARNAGLLLFENKIGIDLIYTSYLKRAVKTNKICLKQLKNTNIEVYKHWRLNERHYGNLQGLNKSQTAKKYGNEQVLQWRRSYDTSPPSMSLDDKRHPQHDILYKNVDPQKLPSSESLKGTLKRVKPLWINKIIPQIKKGQNIMIVAHGNSLRAIVKILKKISDKDIINLNIPTGTPFIFDLDNNLDVVKNYYLGNHDEIMKKIDRTSKLGVAKS